MLARPLSLRLAGVLLAAGALGFVAVFSTLATGFGYPDVLDRPPAEVPPALHAGGAALRATWAVYAALPVVLAAVALLAHDHLRLGVATARVVTASGVAAGVAMATGLLRWSTLQWSLAAAHAGAEPSTRAALEAVSDASNLALGTVAVSSSGRSPSRSGSSGSGRACATGGSAARACSWRRSSRSAACATWCRRRRWPRRSRTSCSPR